MQKYGNNLVVGSARYNRLFNAIVRTYRDVFYDCLLYEIAKGNRVFTYAKQMAFYIHELAPKFKYGNSKYVYRLERKGIHPRLGVAVNRGTINRMIFSLKKNERQFRIRGKISQGLNGIVNHRIKNEKARFTKKPKYIL